MFWLGAQLQISPSPGESGTSYVTQCVLVCTVPAVPAASKSAERFEQGACTNVTDDRRQTDHDTEKCVAIGLIIGHTNE